MSSMLTEVRLLAVPLTSEYKHTLFFRNKNTQQSVFASQVKRTATECSYQRKDKIIRFPALIDEIINCNYVMYRNQSHSSKWYLIK